MTWNCQVCKYVLSVINRRPNIKFLNMRITRRAQKRNNLYEMEEDMEGH